MPHPTCRSPRPVPSEVLELLAEQLLSARLDGSGERDGAALVRIGAGHGTEDLDLGLLPLPEGVHPVDVLVGEVLPARWWATGVIASGRARSLDDPGSSDPIVLVVLVDRDGHCVHRFEARSGLLPADAAPPTGRVVDLLLRTVGRPTPPPTEPPMPWCDAVWLDRIATSVLAGDGRDRELGELAALHPLLSLGATRETIADLRRAQAIDPLAGWRVVQRAASKPGAPDDVAEGSLRAAVSEHLAPEEIPWFDEGSLARWLDAELPSVDDLIALVGALLPDRVARELRAVLDLGPAQGPRDQR